MNPGQAQQLVLQLEQGVPLELMPLLFQAFGKRRSPRGCFPFGGAPVAGFFVTARQHVAATGAGHCSD